MVYGQSQYTFDARSWSVRRRRSNDFSGFRLKQLDGQWCCFLRREEGVWEDNHEFCFGEVIDTPYTQ